jgi:hypothetical protein
VGCLRARSEAEQVEMDCIVLDSSDIKELLRHCRVVTMTEQKLVNTDAAVEKFEKKYGDK